MVTLTRIYTRGGDAGQTSLGRGERVAKHDPRVEAYGTTDEANSVIGLARSAIARTVLGGERYAEADITQCREADTVARLAERADLDERVKFWQKIQKHTPPQDCPGVPE